MDVSRLGLSRARAPQLGLGLVLLLALALRLHGIHDSLLDHPGWRQGDTAAIARNFATLDMNPLHPQTDYDGPPPNYIELELQIVPWLAALAYKLVGIHPVIGRLISLAFGLGTVAALFFFGRMLFASALAGLVAALAFAIYPGAIYYNRTFTPDGTMVFFLTVALLATFRWMFDDLRSGRRFAAAALLWALAVLGKPVAAVGLLAAAAMAVERVVARPGGASPARAPLLVRTLVFGLVALFLAALVPYALYDGYLRSIAEWHWASGIVRLHVLPALVVAFRSPQAFVAKLALFRHALEMLASTMIGPVGTVIAALAVVSPVRARSRGLLWGWLAAVLLYAYVVVTVERVDYYLFLALPLAALWTGGLAALLAERLPRRARALATALGAALAVVALLVGLAEIAPYYDDRPAVYRNAVTLSKTLAPGALVVMGHYDPSVLYYIDRKGWQEDPYLWTPFDEESAIRKGARYFIAVEPRRLARNAELSAWLARFPVLHPEAWPVYLTDPARELPGAERRWRAFRRCERTHGTDCPALAFPPNA